MPNHLLFLSHAGADSAAALALAKRIESSPSARQYGLNVWIDKRDLVPGQQWQQQLETIIDERSTAFAVYLGASGVVNWVENEVRIALSRINDRKRTERYPFIPIISRASVGSSALPAFARQFHSVRDVENSPDELAKLVRTALGLQAEESISLVSLPFMGLNAFTEAHTELFFGREKEVQDLLAKLRDENLLMITGDSGSGKSSLVRAGLVPLFRGGAFADFAGDRPDESAWHILQIRPGSHPFAKLADEVLRVTDMSGRAPRERSELAELVREGKPAKGRPANPDKVRDALTLSGPAQARLLLVVDQFEELWTLTDESERIAFIKLLLTITSPGDFRRRVVVTMRRDYYNLCSEFKSLITRLEEAGDRAKYSVRRMNDDSLRRCILEPLSLAGVTDAEMFAATVLRDVGDQPGDLALLEMALTETWYRREEFGGDLLKAYESVGRVPGALAEAAENIYLKKLATNEKDAEAIFIRLVRLGDTGGTTRRIASRAEFSHNQWQVIQSLATEEYRRLLVVRGDTAELAHEQLVSQWPRYQRWLSNSGGDRKADDKRRLDELIKEAEIWEAAPQKRKKAFLLTGNALETGLKLLDMPDRHVWLAKRECALLSASRAKVNRWRIFRTLAVAALVGLTVISVVAGITLRYKQQEAKQRHYEAVAHSILSHLNFGQRSFSYKPISWPHPYSTDNAYSIVIQKKDFGEAIKALWRLAKIDTQQVRDIFLSELLKSQVHLKMFLSAREPLIRALVGLDDARRDRIVDKYLKDVALQSVPPDRLLALAFLVVHLEAVEEIGLVIEAIQTTSNETQLVELSNGLATLASIAVEKQPGPLVDKLVNSMLQMTPSTLFDKRFSALSLSLRGAIAKSESRAIEIADDLLDRLKQLEESVGNTYESQVGLESSPEIRRLPEPYKDSELISADSRRELMRQEMIRSIREAGSSEKIHVAKPDSGLEFQRVAEVLTVIIAALPQNQLPQVAYQLLEMVKKSVNQDQRESLTGVLAAAGARLSDVEASLLLKEVFEYIKELPNWYKSRSLRSAFLTVVEKANEQNELENVRYMRNMIMNAVRSSRNDPLDISSVAELFAALMHKGITPYHGIRDVQLLLTSVIKCITQTKNVYALNPLVKSLAELTKELSQDRELTDKQVAAMSSLLVDAMQKVNNAEQFTALLSGSVGFAKKLSQKEVQTIVGLIVSNTLSSNFWLDELMLGAKEFIASMKKEDVKHAIAPVTDAFKSAAHPTNGFALSELIELLKVILDKATMPKRPSLLMQEVEILTQKWEEIQGIYDETSDLLEMDANQYGKPGLPISSVRVTEMLRLSCAISSNIFIQEIYMVIADPEIFDEFKKDDQFAKIVFGTLKYPMSTGVQDVLLNIAREAYTDAPSRDQGFWSMVEWARQRFPKLNLARPLTLDSELEFRKICQNFREVPIDKDRNGKG